MLLQWKPSDTFDRFLPSHHNFGDHLPQLFESLFVASEWEALIADQANSYTLIGSMLCDPIIQSPLSGGFTPYYLGCGYRGEPLSAEVLARANIFGCRGYASQQALKAAGKDVEVIGDPAELVPLLVLRPASSHRRVLMPHILDPALETYDALRHGCDLVLSPLVQDKEHLTKAVQEIAGADFVLAGAMHAAIVAHAYGVPFAFFDAGYRDCPKKWEDWGSGVGLDPSQIVFFQDEKNGRAWYDAVRKDLRRTPLLPILYQANKIKTVRWECWAKAWLFDCSQAIQATIL